jgi:hypothetical protein
MTLDNPNQVCNNPTLVLGSCSEPGFFQNIHVINDNNDKIVEFFDLLAAANRDKKGLEIVLGSRRVNSDKSKICVTFNEGDLGRSLDFYIKQLQEEPRLSTEYHLTNRFPLNTDGTNKEVLDKILEMTKCFNVRIINKMCGSCHRSLYYLVQNAKGNFTYSVSPEQGLSVVTDTEQILTCFKA